MGRWPPYAGVVLAALVGAAAALVLDRTAPAPAADVARGSEEAFARALHVREIPSGRAPLRWTTERAGFVFRNLPPGPARLEVRVHGHRGPVLIAADGAVVGRLDVGQTAGDYDLPDTGRGARTVELQAEPFVAGDGRRLGTLLDRVTLVPSARAGPPWGLMLAFALLAALAALAAGAMGWAWPGAAGIGAALALAAALLLWPQGLVRSPYQTTLTAALAGTVVAGAAFARWRERREQGSGRWAFVALLAALLVQGVAATWPSMVVSDAVFHRNNLARVAGGDVFITSLTQHAPPFRFPYGVSFYLLLAPLYRAGLDGVALVRVAAAASGVVASGALFVLAAPLGPARAALAVVVLQLLPGTFDVHSFGNLSNVFGQALTVLFLAWWTGRAPGGWPVGAALVALAGIAHFSCLVVLVALAAVLGWLRWADVRRDRVRQAAVAVGLALAAAYYARFVPLILAQLPRLAEGGGRGGSGLGAALLSPLTGAATQWGIPALLLALAGLPRPSTGTLGRDLTALWLAGAALAVAAVVSPLEVRYLYALAPVLSVAAATGAAALWVKGTFGRALAAALLLGQLVLAGRHLAEALLARYR